jgi:hypothetical protein
LFFSDLIDILPPSSLHSDFEIANPIPHPCLLWVSTESAFLNKPNIYFDSNSVIPTPVSIIYMPISFVWNSATIYTPPTKVNLSALVTRLINIYLNLFSSLINEVIPLLTIL